MERIKVTLLAKVLKIEKDFIEIEIFRENTENCSSCPLEQLHIADVDREIHKSKHIEIAKIRWPTKTLLKVPNERVKIEKEIQEGDIVKVEISDTKLAFAFSLFLGIPLISFILPLLIIPCTVHTKSSILIGFFTGTILMMIILRLVSLTLSKNIINFLDLYVTENL